MPGWRNATLTYHRGMILQRLGRNDEARTVLANVGLVEFTGLGSHAMHLER